VGGKKSDNCTGVRAGEQGTGEQEARYMAGNGVEKGGSEVGVEFLEREFFYGNSMGGWWDGCRKGDFAGLNIHWSYRFDPGL
jgi:hypothetical protein